MLSMRAAVRSGKHRLPMLLCSFALAVFIYLFGAWVFLSVYTKYVFAVCYLTALAYGVLKMQAPPVLSSSRKWRNWVGTAVFACLSLLYFTGTTGRPYGIAPLALPFRSGNYYVFQGGKGLPTNVFHYGLRTAIFAVDLVKLNSAGNRAKHIFSKHLQDYEIYADTLLSPCNGIVLRTEDANPDNIPPSRKRGPTNTNCVLIGNASLYVFMGHLKPGCVFVHEGDSVHTGQPIACCGNSGFSIEPHLHIQAHARTNEGIPWYMEPPLLISFDGRVYNLFEEITKKQTGQ